MSIEIGTEGEVIPGVRSGLPDHIDGVPVRWGVPSFVLPRRGAFPSGPLPMIELREDDDAGKIAARWPEPFSEHSL